MPRPGRNRIDADQTQALSHPVRLGIVALFRKNPVRSLATHALLEDLIAEDPDTFGEFKECQIFYHRSRLQKAELLPG